MIIIETMWDDRHDFEGVEDATYVAELSLALGIQRRRELTGSIVNLYLATRIKQDEPASEETDES